MKCSSYIQSCRWVHIIDPDPSHTQPNPHITNNSQPVAKRWANAHHHHRLYYARSANNVSVYVSMFFIDSCLPSLFSVWLSMIVLCCVLWVCDFAAQWGEIKLYSRQHHHNHNHHHITNSSIVCHHMSPARNPQRISSTVSTFSAKIAPQIWAT